MANASASRAGRYLSAVYENRVEFRSLFGTCPESMVLPDFEWQVPVLLN